MPSSSHLRHDACDIIYIWVYLPNALFIGFGGIVFTEYHILLITFE